MKSRGRSTCGHHAGTGLWIYKATLIGTWPELLVKPQIVWARHRRYSRVAHGDIWSLCVVIIHPGRAYKGLPLLPPPIDPESKVVLKACIAAHKGLAELKQAARLIPNQIASLAAAKRKIA